MPNYYYYYYTVPLSRSRILFHIFTCFFSFLSFCNILDSLSLKLTHTCYSIKLNYSLSA